MQDFIDDYVFPLLMAIFITSLVAIFVALAFGLCVAVWRDFKTPYTVIREVEVVKEVTVDGRR